jgi:hypothetical protein
LCKNPLKFLGQNTLKISKSLLFLFFQKIPKRAGGFHKEDFVFFPRQAGSCLAGPLPSIPPAAGMLLAAPGRL